MFKKVLIANRGEIACGSSAPAARWASSRWSSFRGRPRRQVRRSPTGGASVRRRRRTAISTCRRSSLTAEVTDAEAIHPGTAFSRRTPTSPSVSRKRVHVHRADAGVDPHDGRQGRRQAGDDPLGRALRAGIRRRAAGRRQGDHPPGARDRLPGDHRAAGGGGGRGMRVVHTEAALLTRCRRRGRRRGIRQPGGVHGKFLQNPRHIEIQVLADTHGNAVWLGERDCSMQRRHQKIIEEAPAPGIAKHHRAHRRALRRGVQERSATAARERSSSCTRTASSTSSR